METTQRPGTVPGKNAEASFLVLNMPGLEPGAAGRNRPAYGVQYDATWSDPAPRSLKAQWILIIAIVGFVAGWVAANLLPG